MTMLRFRRGQRASDHPAVERPRDYGDCLECKICGRSQLGLYVHYLTGVCTLCERNLRSVSR